MNLITRRNNLIQQIKEVGDEKTLELLEETLLIHLHTDVKYITDGLSTDQMHDLVILTGEPAEKDTISEEFNQLFARWSTK